MEDFKTKTLKEVWTELGNTPVNEDMELDEKFLSYPIGTNCTEIWHDIEEYYNVCLGEYQFSEK